MYKRDNFLCNIQTAEGIIQIDSNVQMHILFGGNNPLDNKLNVASNKVYYILQKYWRIRWEYNKREQWAEDLQYV